MSGVPAAVMRRILAYLAILLTLPTGFANSKALVWCVGNDGHSAIEFCMGPDCHRHAGSEHAQQDDALAIGGETHSRDVELAIHASGCVDTAVLPQSCLFRAAIVSSVGSDQASDDPVHVGRACYNSWPSLDHANVQPRSAVRSWLSNAVDPLVMCRHVTVLRI